MIPPKRHLHILLALIGVVLLNACDRSRDKALRAEWWRLEAQRVSLASDVKLLTFRLEHQTRAQSGFAAAEERLATARRTKVDLETQLDQLRLENKELATSLARHRQESQERRRNEWSGKAIRTLTTTTGRQFEDVTVARVSEIGIEIRHKTGLARLTSDDLNREQCREFGIDPARSSELVALEEERQQRYRERIDSQLAADREERSTELTRRPVTIRRTPPTPSIAQWSNPLREPARSFGSPSFYRSDYSSRYRRDSRVRYYTIRNYSQPTCRYTPTVRPSPTVRNYCPTPRAAPPRPVPCPTR